MRTIAHAVGMFVFGAVALLGAGLLFNVRVMRPLPSAEQSAAIIGTSGGTLRRSPDVLSAALGGIVTDVQVASDLLDEDRPGAAARLDAALRIADVLRYATTSPLMERIYRQVSTARRLVQNGDGETAATVARNVAAIRPADPAAHERRDIDYGRYTGAQVIDTIGEHRGTVVSAGRQQLVIETPSWRNILGFIDLSHGQTREFQAADVLFGEPKTIGKRLVLVMTRDSGS